MFVFKSTLELVELEKRRLQEDLKWQKECSRDLQDRVKTLEREAKHANEEKEFAIRQACHQKSMEMQKCLIESDMKRVEAIAKLNVYEKMDTKDERKHIEKMLEKAIDGLSRSPQVIVQGSK